MKKISAEIVADSINPQGDRITSYLLTFPRFVLAELNTHRVFSKNSASSRAIPFTKMVEAVENNPFIPIAWQKDHKGMQGSEYFTDEKDIYRVEQVWRDARRRAVDVAKDLHSSKVTKQLCNRLLEPFMWHTVLLTATEFENFFELRCPQYTMGTSDGFYKSRKDLLKAYPANKSVLDVDLYWLSLNKGQAEIHIQALAESMWDAMNESTPKTLQNGEWHIPFGDNIDEKELDKLMPEIQPASLNWHIEQLNILKIKVATARCARLSYMTFDGEIDYEKDLKLHDSLLQSGHASPFEHCCRVLTEEEYNILGKMVLQPENGYVFENGWVDNFKGFISYRRLLNI